MVIYVYMIEKWELQGLGERFFFLESTTGEYRRPYQNSELGGETIYISNGLYHIYVYI